MNGRVTLAHGGGGEAMHDLVETVFLAAFSSPHLAPLEDQARLPMAIAPEERLAFTTDAHVVQPLFFPGGDIGRLAVAGTVNDLAVGGACPRHLSCAFIIEEGLPLETLRQVAASMAETAAEAGVSIVTGDTKVVPRGAADGLFLTTSGVGVIPAGRTLGAAQIQPGDVVLVSGPVGNHGAAILAARDELGLSGLPPSDCRPLNGLIEALLHACPETRCLRDATRGGLAAVANEFAAASATALLLEEAAIPVHDGVRGLCELLGMDPLHLANEGVVVAVVPAPAARRALTALHAHPDGRWAARVGEVLPGPAGRALLETRYGGRRIIEPPPGELLPRIC